MYTWGDGIKGQLGHGDMDSRSKPELVKTLAGKSITRYSILNLSCIQGYLSQCMRFPTMWYVGPAKPQVS